jgi:hypothetical protein
MLPSFAAAKPTQSAKSWLHQIEYRSSALKKTGRKVANAMLPGQERDEVLEAVPADWNVASKQLRPIAAGANSLDFDIHTK